MEEEKQHEEEIVAERDSLLQSKRKFEHDAQQQEKNIEDLKQYKELIHLLHE